MKIREEGMKRERGRSSDPKSPLLSYISFNLFLMKETTTGGEERREEEEEEEKGGG